jgi:hypothetical protein
MVPDNAQRKHFGPRPARSPRASSMVATEACDTCVHEHQAHERTGCRDNPTSPLTGLVSASGTALQALPLEAGQIVAFWQHPTIKAACHPNRGIFGTAIGLPVEQGPRATIDE